MRYFLASFILSITLLCSILVDAQDGGVVMRSYIPLNSCRKSSSPLFRSDSIINIMIIADFKRLLEHRLDEPEYSQGKLFYFTRDSIPLYMDIKIRQRGNFRRQASNCTFPPLKVNFKKKSVVGTVFEGQDIIKLVTHCRERLEYEQNIINEYLAYRVYNRLTDYSYKVRLAKVTYIDSSGRRKPISRYGFFIETREEFERRNCVSFVETKNLHQEVVDRYQMTLLAIFQYFIGNTDWSVPNRHNIDLYVGNPIYPFIPVTFDFDFSGLVNAKYAQPQPMLGINKVTDRLYRGFTRKYMEIDSVLAIFRREEINILQEQSVLPRVTNRGTKETTNFINSFFEEIKEAHSVKRIFIDGSRKAD